MTKKIIIIAIILLAGLIGLILLKGEGGISTSTKSPEAVVKAFYEAVKKGNFEKAKEYISLTGSIESFLETSFCTSFNLSEKENQFLKEDCLISLGGAIANIVIENKQTEKAFGREQAVLAVKVNFKSDAKEEAERRFEEEKKKHVLQRDIWVILKNRYLAEFPEKQEVWLEKYEQGWKIVNIEF